MKQNNIWTRLVQLTTTFSKRERAGPFFPPTPSIFLLRSLSLLSRLSLLTSIFLSLSPSRVPCEEKWGRLSVDDVCVCLSLVCRVTRAPMAARVWRAGRVSFMGGLCQLCVCVCLCE